MKKLITLFFIGLITISGFAQEQKPLRKIKANGIVQEKNRRVPKYTKLIVEGEVNIEILNNDFKNVIRTNGDGNLQQLYSIVVANEVLTIKRKPGFEILNQTVPFKITLATKDLTDLTLNGDKGTITNMGAIEILKLNLTNTGGGKMELRVKTDELVLNTENSGAIKVEGTANFVKINSKSTGDIDAKDLSTFYTEVESNGSGNIYTNTVNGIDGNLNSTGNLYYRVTKTVNVSENAEGKVIKQ